MARRRRLRQRRQARPVRRAARRLSVLLPAGRGRHVRERHGEGGLPSPPEDGLGAVGGRRCRSRWRSRHPDRRPHRAQLLRNNGNGTFTDISRTRRVSAAAGGGMRHCARPTSTIGATSISWSWAGTGPPLYRNMRDGTFRDATTEAGLRQRGVLRPALAAGDVNKDGYIDFFFGRRPPGHALR